MYRFCLKTLRYVMRTLMVIAACLFVMVAIAFLHLSDGRLSLNQFKPDLIALLFQNNEVVDFRNAYVQWQQVRHPFVIRFEDFSYKATAESEEIRIPSLDVELSGKDLLHGKVSVYRIGLVRPSLTVVRQEAGNIAFQDTAPAERDTKNVGIATETLLEELISDKTDVGQQLSSLQAVEVANARLTVVDRLLGQTWHFSNVSFHAMNRGNGHLALDGQATLLKSEMDLKGVSAQFEGTLNIKTLKYQAHLETSRFNPETDLPPLPFLDGFNLVHAPIQAKLDAIGEKDTGILDADIKIGAGYVDAAFLKSGRVPVSHAQLKSSIQFKNSQLKQGTLSPSYVMFSQPLPQGALNFKGTLGYQDNQWAGNLQIDGKTLPIVPLVRNLWPNDIAAPVYDWLSGNFKAGTITSATFKTGFVGETLQSLSVLDLQGQAQLRDVTMSYFGNMPKLQKGAATVHFAKDRIDIDVAHAHVPGIDVHNSRVSFTGLAQDIQTLNIKLAVQSDIQPILALLDSKPLGLMAKWGKKVEDFFGKADASIEISFPLLNALNIDDVQFHATGHVSNGKLLNAYKTHTMVSPRIDVEVTPKKATVAGNMELAGIPLDMHSVRYLKAGDYQEKTSLKGQVTHAQLKAIGLNIERMNIFTTGTLQVDVDVINKDGAQVLIGAQLGLTDADIWFPPLNWYKPQGEISQMNIAVNSRNGTLLDIPRFSFSAGTDVSFSGRYLGQKHDSQKLNIDHFRFAGSDGAIQAVFDQDGKINVNITGNQLDAYRLAENLLESHQPGNAKSFDRNVQLSGGFKTALFQNTNSPARRKYVVKDLSFSGFSENGAIGKLSLFGKMAHDDPVNITLRNTQDGRVIEVKSNNAGDVLKTLGLFDNMEQGVLNLVANMRETGVVTGTMDIQNFQVQRTPVLARLLTVASLTGILDLLDGNGIHFDTLHAPFTFKDDILQIEDAIIKGLSLGLTTQGTVNVAQGQLNLQGNIVPVYAVNNLVGKIPLLGDLITGGDGKGLFSATYIVDGHKDDPKVKVNPFAALAPGPLRNIFDSKTK